MGLQPVTNWRSLPEAPVKLFSFQNCFCLEPFGTQSGCESPTCDLQFRNSCSSSPASLSPLPLHSSFPFQIQERAAKADWEGLGRAHSSIWHAILGSNDAALRVVNSDCSYFFLNMIECWKFLEVLSKSLGLLSVVTWGLMSIPGDSHPVLEVSKLYVYWSAICPHCMSYITVSHTELIKGPGLWKEYK